MNIKLKPITYFADKRGLSGSFARTLRKKYDFGEKWGGAWYCTQKEWDEALMRHIADAGNTQAGKPHTVNKGE